MSETKLTLGQTLDSLAALVFFFAAMFCGFKAQYHEGLFFITTAIYFKVRFK